MPIKLPQVLPQVVEQTPQNPGKITPQANTAATDATQQLGQGMFRAGAAFVRLGDKAIANAQAAEAKEAYNQFSKAQSAILQGTANPDYVQGDEDDREAKVFADEGVTVSREGEVDIPLRQAVPPAQPKRLPGYLDTVGKDAMKRQDEAATQLDKLWTDIRDSISDPEARRSFEYATSAERIRGQTQVYAHGTKQSQVWNAGASKAFAADKADQVAQTGGSPDMNQEVIDANIETAEVLGQNPELGRENGEAALRKSLGSFATSLVTEAETAQSEEVFGVAESYIKDNEKALGKAMVSSLRKRMVTARATVRNQQGAARDKAQEEAHKNWAVSQVDAWYGQDAAETPALSTARAYRGLSAYKRDNAGDPRLAANVKLLRAEIEANSKRREAQYEARLENLNQAVTAGVAPYVAGEPMYSPEVLKQKDATRLAEMRREMSSTEEGRTLLEKQDKAKTAQQTARVERNVSVATVLFNSDSTGEAFASEFLREDDESGRPGKGPITDASVARFYMEELNGDPVAIGKVNGFVDHVRGVPSAAGESANVTRQFKQILSVDQARMYQQRQTTTSATGAVSTTYSPSEGAVQLATKLYLQYVKTTKSSGPNAKVDPPQTWFIKYMADNDLWDRTPGSASDPSLADNDWLMSTEFLGVTALSRQSLSDGEDMTAMGGRRIPGGDPGLLWDGDTFEPLPHSTRNGESLRLYGPKSIPKDVYETLLQGLDDKDLGSKRQETLAVAREWAALGYPKNKAEAVSNLEDLQRAKAGKLGEVSAGGGVRAATERRVGASVADDDFSTVFSQNSAAYTSTYVSPYGNLLAGVKPHKANALLRRLERYQTVDQMLGAMPASVLEILVDSHNEGVTGAMFPDTTRDSALVKTERAAAMFGSDLQGPELREAVNALLFAQTYVDHQVDSVLVENTQLESTYRDLDRIYEYQMVNDEQRAKLDGYQLDAYVDARRPSSRTKGDTSWSFSWEKISSPTHKGAEWSPPKKEVAKFLAMTPSQRRAATLKAVRASK